MMQYLKALPLFILLALAAAPSRAALPDGACTGKVCTGTAAEWTGVTPDAGIVGVVTDLQCTFTAPGSVTYANLVKSCVPIIHNLTATGDPTVNDDVDLGYFPGAYWINTASGEAFILVDNTDGAADWNSTTAAGGGSEATTVSDSATLNLTLSTYDISGETDCLFNGTPTAVTTTATPDFSSLCIAVFSVTGGSSVTLAVPSADTATANREYVRGVQITNSTGGALTVDISAYSLESLPPTVVIANGDADLYTVLTRDGGTTWYILGPKDLTKLPSPTLSGSDLVPIQDVSATKQAQTTTQAIADLKVVTEGEVKAHEAALGIGKGQIDDLTAWRVWYSDASGNFTELALGTSGQYLQSNGATSAPTWSTPAGSGDVSKVGTPVDDQIGVWTGDGTIEGTSAFTFTATQFKAGNFVFNRDQTVGAGQDNYVLTYDNGTGEIGLEAATGGGASQLSDLSDVGVTTPTDRNALMADGDSWESRALVDADVPDALTIAGGVINTTPITLVQSATPTPTAEGVCEWDADDDHFMCGDGTGTVPIGGLQGTEEAHTLTDYVAFWDSSKAPDDWSFEAASSFLDDDNLPAAASATNYTPAAATVAGHLSGIDTALGSAGGSGDVVGPASAVDSNFAAFDTTTGKLIKDSGSAASAFATAAQGATADTALQPGDVDDTPVNGVTTAPVSSNWAFDHDADTQAHGITAYTATLLDDANETAFKATLNAEAGVDFQAYDADLDGWAAISPTTGSIATTGTLSGAVLGVEVTGSSTLGDSDVSQTFVTNFGMATAGDTTLPATAKRTKFTILVEAAGKTWSLKPPSGEAFVLDGTALDANDEIDIGQTVGDSAVLLRVKTSAAPTYQWHFHTATGTHTDGGAT